MFLRVTGGCRIIIGSKSVGTVIGIKHTLPIDLIWNDTY